MARENCTPKTVCWRESIICEGLKMWDRIMKMSTKRDEDPSLMVRVLEAP